MTTRKLAVTVLLLVTTAWPTLAWGPDAHVTIALIAEAHLTPAARRAVRAVLGTNELADPELVMWPDEIRGKRTHEDVYPGNGAWHFVDMDVLAPVESLLPIEGEDNVVIQVTRWRDELANKALPKARRLDALRFLTHFMADLHQPLHCAYRYYDMGGNMIPINSFEGAHFVVTPDTPADRAPNLHTVWDEYLVKELLGPRTPNELANDLLADISDEQKSEWIRDDPAHWALESHLVARERAYRWADGEFLPFKWRRPGSDLTVDNYIAIALPYVRIQLQRAGIRLAHYLNMALDPAYARGAEKAPVVLEQHAASEVR